jgi:hypothetical protein
LQKTSDNYNSPNNTRGYGLASAQNAINYPNFELVSDSYKIHKMFISEISINPSTVKLNYSVESGNFQQVDMTYDGTLRYNYVFPDLSNNQNIEFYFTYSDMSGGNYREPVSGNYGQLVLDVEEDNNPANFVLYQNYPNPFNPATTIKYQIPEDGFVTIKIYDILGNEVKTLINEQKSKGSYSLMLDSSDLVSGVYIYRIQVNNFTSAKKMMVLK